MAFAKTVVSDASARHDIGIPIVNIRGDDRRTPKATSRR